MKSLGTLKVQNKMFNLHIIQVIYKIRKGKKPEQILEHVDTFMHEESRENTSNTNRFCAINSLMTKWPYVISCKC